jgi:hypothetical protein
MHDLQFSDALVGAVRASFRIREQLFSGLCGLHTFDFLHNSRLQPRFSISQHTSIYLRANVHVYNQFLRSFVIVSVPTAPGHTRGERG